MPGVPGWKSSRSWVSGSQGTQRQVILHTCSPSPHDVTGVNSAANAHNVMVQCSAAQQAGCSGLLVCEVLFAACMRMRCATWERGVYHGRQVVIREAGLHELTRGGILQGAGRSRRLLGGCRTACTSCGVPARQAAWREAGRNRLLPAGHGATTYCPRCAACQAGCGVSVRRTPSACSRSPELETEAAGRVGVCRGSGPGCTATHSTCAAACQCCEWCAESRAAELPKRIQVPPVHAAYRPACSRTATRLRPAPVPPLGSDNARSSARIMPALAVQRSSRFGW